MFLAKKAITQFLLPPGLFISILLCAGIRELVRRHRRAGLFCVSAALVMWGLTIAPFTDALLGPLESAYSIPLNPKGDVIVLLGGGVNDDVADLTGRGAPSEEMMVRTVTAVRLYQRLRVPVIISGGSGYQGRAPEAPIVKRFLVNLGVPESMLIVESSSRDTVENARYVEKIIEERNFRNPILVTSAYHMRRAVMLFERAGVKVLPVPTDFKVRMKRCYYPADFLPGSFHTAATALKEYLGILFYKLA